MELLEREPHRAALLEYAAEARSGSGRLLLVSVLYLPVIFAVMVLDKR